MALIFAIVVTLLTAGFYASLSSRLNVDCFDEKQLKIIREQRKYVLIFGMSNAVLCWFNYYMWNYALPNRAFLPVCLTIVTIVLFFVLLLMFGFAPSEKSVGHQNQYLQNKKKLEEFLSVYTIDRTITVYKTTFAVCMKEQTILIYHDITASSYELFYKAISFSSVTGCDLIEDQSTVLSGGVGRAVAGAVIAGGVGAVVGAATRKSNDVTNQMNLQIYTKDVLNPLYEIIVIDHQVMRNSNEYKELLQKAQKICATIDAIVKQP